MTILKTFKVNSNPTSIGYAIAQCEATLFDMGCSTTTIHGDKFIKVVSNEAILNTQTNKTSKVAFKLIPKN
jgi:hypothetical protein